MNTGTYSRVTGILSFYDEPTELLAASVSSLTDVVDHLVVVDGAYMLYPQGKPSSDPDQMRLITEICRGARIGLTTHTPVQVWSGNEVQKRNHALWLAEAVTNEDGWYLVLDADCIITQVSPSWFKDVHEIAEDGWGAIDLSVRETRPIPGVELDPEDSYAPIRLMYRALRNMQYGPSHWTLRAPDPNDENEWLFFWGPKEFEPVSSYDGKHLLKFDHRHDRPEYRRVNQRKYYAKRDQLHIEDGHNQLMTRGLDGKFHARNKNRP